MISFLIACYEQDIRALVQSIHLQGKQRPEAFEIIAHDNGPDPSIHEMLQREFQELEGVRFEAGKSSPSRSASRNWLASQAQFPYLVFLDGDSAPPDTRYVDRYFDLLPTDSVWVGGTAYRQEAPEKGRRLRWVYGRAREERSARSRSSAREYGFSSFNFLIPASLFRSVQFKESIMDYGHEDTLFGVELADQGIHLSHCDNPLLHEGLDEDAVFLEKTRTGIHTLLQLIQEGTLKKGTRLYERYRRIQKFGLAPLYKLLFGMLRGAWERNLKSARPSLILFDLWRLGVLCELNKKKDPVMQRGLRSKSND
jgi:glycosyltransferase involved in cell wall biosynthesis